MGNGDGGSAGAGRPARPAGQLAAPRAPGADAQRRRYGTTTGLAVTREAHDPNRRSPRSVPVLRRRPAPRSANERARGRKQVRPTPRAGGGTRSGSGGHADGGGSLGHRRQKHERPFLQAITVGARFDATEGVHASSSGRKRRDNVRPPNRIHRPPGALDPGAVAAPQQGCSGGAQVTGNHGPRAGADDPWPPRHGQR